MDEARAVLEGLPLFRFVPAQLRKVVVDCFSQRPCSFGETIVREDEEPDALHVILSGRARVLKTAAGGEELTLRTVRRGDSFGRLGVARPGRGAVTVRASSDVQLASLPLAVSRELFESHPELELYVQLEVKYRALHDLFRVYPAFGELPVDGLSELIDGLRELEVESGSQVMRAGEEAGPMFLVTEGRLRVFREEAGERRYLSYLRKGEFFGEMGVFQGSPRTVSVEAESACKLLVLESATYQRLRLAYPGFHQAMDQRIAQADFRRVARVPIDFTEENLPAEAEDQSKASPSQADPIAEAATESEGPFVSPEGYFVKRGKRIRKFPHVQQIDEMDCGAACLAMIVRYYGRAVSLARIRKVIHTAVDGTSLKGLVRGAEELGLAARPVKASVRNLDAMPLPAIVLWEGAHWIVVYHVDQDFVHVDDPSVGKRKIERQRFDKVWSGYAALFDYTTAFEQEEETEAGFGWLLPFFKPFTGIIARALGLAFVVSALGMVLPVFTQVVVDRVLVDRDTGLLQTMMLSMMALLVFMAVSVVVQRYLLAFVAVRLDTALFDYLTRRLLQLPMSYFQSRRTGDIQRRMAGMAAIRRFVVNNAVIGLASVTQLAVAVGLMMVYSPLLGFVFLGATPLYAGLMRFSSGRLRPLFADLEEAFGKYHSQQIDAIKGIETVKAMGAEGPLRELMLGEFHGLARKLFRANFTMMSYDGVTGVITFLSASVFLWVGALQVMAGELTIGGLMAFNSLVAYANQPILALLSRWDNFQSVSVLVDRLNDIFEQEPEQGRDRSQLQPVHSVDGQVQLQRMTFQYGGPESPKILEDVTFEAAPGQTVAIVGRSGSGKTTLIKCLAGLLEPTEGTILYDGADMKTLNYRDLRSQIGFVLQENYLFNDTISRNVAFGEDEPDMDRVLWAARVANAHEFIERLPLGYETKVGESGLAISGGQKQRVAIARAVYRRPPILIFDEATSALDTESEKAVKENMDQLLHGRTSFVIAHRLSTIRDADLILVLEKGRLVEQGNHDQLMSRQGLYYYLCSQQLDM